MGVGMGRKIHGRDEAVSKSFNLHDPVSIYQFKLGSFWGHTWINWDHCGVILASSRSHPGIILGRFLG